LTFSRNKWKKILYLFLAFILVGIILVISIYGLRSLTSPAQPPPSYIPYDDKAAHAEEENLTIKNIYNYSRIDFYAYGDSITAPEYCYIQQMVEQFLPGEVALHNTDGTYRNSTWARNNIPWHYNKSMKYFVYMFTNDGNTLFHPYPPGGIGGEVQEDFPINLTVENYLAIYEYVKANGTTPIPMIPIITQRGSGGASYNAYTIENLTTRIHALESAFDQRGIFYVKMYDALDSIPWNGKPDDYNWTAQYLMPRGVHPTVEGHKIMAEYLWTQLSKHYNL
jgi:hypothetical protein